MKESQTTSIQKRRENEEIQKIFATYKKEVKALLVFLVVQMFLLFAII